MTMKIAVANFNPAGGSVINISSLAAQGDAPGRAVYAASKAAVNAITKVLALELAERKIRVNAIMPGYYDTEGARAFGLPGSEAEARLIAATPLEKRPGRPSDLSPVTLFLASAASAWITGEILSVSGGLR
jgi:3-oxoacyl-[acyl-carrier protein] reductase